MDKPNYMINNVEALYPKLDQPYRFQQGGGKNGQGGTVPCEATAKGAEYTTKFKMTGAQAKELFKAMVAAYEEQKQDSWPPLEIPFEKDEEGAFIGKAKIAAAYDQKIVEPPRHYDSNNQRLEAGFQLTRGSTINLYVQLSAYNGNMGQGISLRLRGVQIIKLKEFVPPSPFEAQEGFTQEGSAQPTEDEVDSIFDTVVAEEPKAANEEVKEPKVRANKKKTEPPANKDITDLLDEFDD